MQPIIVGVVAFQGAVSEHIECTKKAMNELGVEGDAIPVKTPEELSQCCGLIIPGGESTAINRLMKSSGVFQKIKELGKKAFPIFGTCAGAILLSKSGDEQCEKTGELLGLIDVRINRNAFGRQKESFEAKLDVNYIGAVNAVFIRAPLIEEAGKDVEILAKLEGGGIVAARQGNVLIACFHPELSGTDMHRYFLGIVREQCKRGPEEKR